MIPFQKNVDVERILTRFLRKVSISK